MRILLPFTLLMAIAIIVGLALTMPPWGAVAGSVAAAVILLYYYFLTRQLRVLRSFGIILVGLNTRNEPACILNSSIPKRITPDNIRALSIYSLLESETFRSYVASSSDTPLVIRDTQDSRGWIVKKRPVEKLLSPPWLWAIKYLGNIREIVLINRCEDAEKEFLLKMKSLIPHSENDDLLFIYHLIRSWLNPDHELVLYRIERDSHKLTAISDGTVHEGLDDDGALYEELTDKEFILESHTLGQVKKYLSKLPVGGDHPEYWISVYIHRDEKSLYYILVGSSDKESLSELQDVLEDRLPLLITMGWGLGHGYALNAPFIFRQLLDGIPVGVFFKDRLGHYIYVNRSMRAFFNIPLTAIAGKRVEEVPFLPENVIREAKEVERLIFETGEPQKRIFRLSDPRGNERLMAMRYVPVRAEDGTIQGLLGTASEITEQVDLSKRVQLLASVIATVNMNLFLITPEGTLVYVNETYKKKFNRTFGLSLDDLIKKNVNFIEYLKRFLSDTMHKRLKDAIQEALEYGHSATRLNYEVPTLEGERANRVYEINFYRIEWHDPYSDEKDVVILGSGEDITHRVRLQNFLSITQKMESVARLAGGLAHDFNNILTGIIGEVEYILTSEEAIPSEYRSELKQIKDLAAQASHLSRQLLELVRPDERQYGECDLTKVIKNFVDFISHSFPSNIKIEALIDENVAAYTPLPDSQVHQILMNMAVNARDAMPDGGTLSIDFRPYQPHPFQDGKQAHMLQIRDTGHGIPEEIREKIFEPFFTTKGRKKGTGLGLSVVYSIITGVGGSILCDSEEGKGTTFTIYFPVLERVSKRRRTTPSRQLSPLSNIPVLVVDDEEVIRKVLSRGLPRVGFEPLMAASPSEAIEILRNHKKDIKIALIDMDMPEMDGVALAKELHAISPDMPMVIMTGHLQSKYSFKEPYITQVVQKPFELKKLGKVLRLSLQGDESQES